MGIGSVWSGFGCRESNRPAAPSLPLGCRAGGRDTRRPGVTKKQRKEAYITCGEITKSSRPASVTQRVGEGDGVDIVAVRPTVSSRPRRAPAVRGAEDQATLNARLETGVDLSFFLSGPGHAVRRAARGGGVGRSSAGSRQAGRQVVGRQVVTDRPSGGQPAVRLAAKPGPAPRAHIGIYHIWTNVS
jgi:hypothetical protein